MFYANLTSMYVDDIVITCINTSLSTKIADVTILIVLRDG